MCPLLVQPVCLVLQVSLATSLCHSKEKAEGSETSTWNCLAEIFSGRGKFFLLYSSFKKKSL